MTTYDPKTATFRGTPDQITAVLDDLRSHDGAADAPARAGIAEAQGDPLVGAMSAALREPVFRIELTVSGPGGHQRHRIEVGRNAVAVRESPVRDDVAELNGSPVTLLPAGMARLVRFRAGAPAPVGAADLPVAPAAALALGDSEKPARLQAWSRVEPVLRDAGYAGPADRSWQLVQSRASWTADGGEDAHEVAVHLRYGAHHFLVGGDESAAALVPVDSVVAWESMVSVLPGQGEVRRD